MSSLLAGCGILDDRQTGVAAMNMQEAAERLDSMLDGTISAIKPKVQWAHDDTTTGSCSLTRRRTVMTVISEQRRGSFLGVVERFWKKSGYQITSVDKDKDFPAVFAQTADGFGISLTIADKGQAYFEGDSPCVKKAKVANPTAKPNGPDYAGVPIPRPNVRSDFWSANTPVPPRSPSAG
ncbi:hypothetical protein J7E91_01140 [Streptomyces sp. ISL-99]|uniref:hypothetical protein n=1 Tax=Streptomyces sp. ISL-99 TaxID=2819193 RepID=UPI001BE8A5D5|nr:hypothetical protein [Streptomyces sp. ISL-99]MBT2524068.1 hypothetical protein [Streptomyces sp. ISL-99]